jgi:hypothetical protein
MYLNYAEREFNFYQMCSKINCMELNQDLKQRFRDYIDKRKSYLSFGDLGKRLVKIGKSYDLASYYLKVLTEKRLLKK